MGVLVGSPVCLFLSNIEIPQVMLAPLRHFSREEVKYVVTKIKLDFDSFLTIISTRSLLVHYLGEQTEITIKKKKVVL